jgi:hypothetical protein
VEQIVGDPRKQFLLTHTGGAKQKGERWPPLAYTRLWDLKIFLNKCIYINILIENGSKTFLLAECGNEY